MRRIASADGGTQEGAIGWMARCCVWMGVRRARTCVDPQAHAVCGFRERYVDVGGSSADVCACLDPRGGRGICGELLGPTEGCSRVRIGWMARWCVCGWACDGLESVWTPKRMRMWSECMCQSVCMRRERVCGSSTWRACRVGEVCVLVPPSELCVEVLRPRCLSWR